MSFWAQPGLRRRPRLSGFPNSLYPSWDSCCISEVCSPTTKAVDENKDASEDFRDRNDSLKIQDDGDVDVLRDPERNNATVEMRSLYL